MVNENRLMSNDDNISSAINGVIAKTIKKDIKQGEYKNGQATSINDDSMSLKENGNNIINNSSILKAKKTRKSKTVSNYLEEFSTASSSLSFISNNVNQETNGSSSDQYAFKSNSYCEDSNDSRSLNSDGNNKTTNTNQTLYSKRTRKSVDYYGTKNGTSKTTNGNSTPTSATNGISEKIEITAARVHLKRKSTSSINSNVSDLNKNGQPKKTNEKIKKNKNVETEEEGNEEDEESESDSQDDQKVDLEYAKLQPSNSVVYKHEPVCIECEMTGELIKCQGECKNSFHLDCAGILEPSLLANFKCDQCLTGQHICFECKNINSPKENSTITKKCSHSKCGKYYHDECARSNPLFRKDAGTSSNAKYTCPLHTCTTCWCESKTLDSNDSTNLVGASKGPFVECIRCPTAYHLGDFCLAAGSIIINSSYILCPNHFQPVKNQAHHNRVSVTWCFVCTRSHELIGCNRCPAAYHLECLDNPPTDVVLPNGKIFNLEKLKNNTNNGINKRSLSPSNQTATSSENHSPESVVSASSANTINSANSVISVNWTCDDCVMGKKPLYGQIVWAKVSSYRWWPAQICKPQNLPPKINKQIHQVGEFPVQFFGSNDYYWVHIGRCFTFADGDEETKTTKSNITKALAEAFDKGVQQAKEAFDEVEKRKQNRLSKTNGIKTPKFDFQLIKTSRPFGNVAIHRLPISELPRCDCDPKSANPCSTDDCVNRALKYECHPLLCPAGDRCQNQRFSKRLYPKQVPIPAGDRGWGLKCTKDIKKGEFVNEYVGEIIDEEECKRRLDLFHKTNGKSFYFLTLDKDRVIDAGPKGNLCRFINHSCSPNLETQKWNVNGDIRVGLFAVCDIPAHTELTFNYNLECVSNEKCPCKCGASNCSGFIGVRPKNNTNNNENKSSTSGSEITSKADDTTSNKNNSSNSKKRKLSEIKGNARKSLGTLKQITNNSNSTKQQKSIKPRARSSSTAERSNSSKNMTNGIKQSK